MQIYGTTNLSGAQPIKTNQAASTAQPQNTTSIDTVDQLDISSEAQMLSDVHQIPDVRADKVAEIRSQIESGQYETEYKLEQAVVRLMDELV